VTAAPPGPGHPLNQGPHVKATITRKGCTHRQVHASLPAAFRPCARIPLAGRALAAGARLALADSFGRARMPRPGCAPAAVRLPQP